jgi:crotonobetaine/carnitine-CoA ligase
VGGERGREIFAGYLDDPETTEVSFEGGWFRTGDLAYADEHGIFRFAGRRGDILKVSGENVSVVEVEAVLATHPAVFEAAVVGEADPVRDEIPVAYVVVNATTAPGDGGTHARTQAEPQADELIAWCRERLSPAKVPREIRFVPELPRTSVGKIRKFMLRSADKAPS